MYARKVESEAAGGGSAGTEPTVDLATITRTGSGADTRVNITLNEDIDSQALITSDEADLAGGKVLVLTPTGTSQTIRWECTSNLPASKMPKVCTFDDSAGGPTAWASLSDEDKASNPACWNQSVAASAADGNGWVVGANDLTPEDQATLRKEIPEYISQYGINRPPGCPRYEDREDCGDTPDVESRDVIGWYDLRC